MPETKIHRWVDIKGQHAGSVKLRVTLCKTCHNYCLRQCRREFRDMGADTLAQSERWNQEGEEYLRFKIV